MSRYKLIRKYPGCHLEVGDIISFKDAEELVFRHSDGYEYTYLLKDATDYPEFWELLK